MTRRSYRHMIMLMLLAINLQAQSSLPGEGGGSLMKHEILSGYVIRTTPPEDCSNGADDDGDGSIDCADGDCQLLANGGFEDVPVAPNPNSFITFPQYPTFMGSWAAVNIDGEVFYQSPNRPAYEGNKYASLLQNAGANPRQPWNETSWSAGGYDRFVFITNTHPGTDYQMRFYHASDNRYAYYGGKTLVQVQSMNTDYYYDTLITTPGLFNWTEVDLSFQTDAQTHAVAILFSTLSPGNSSVLVDGLQLCGARVAEIQAVDDTISLQINSLAIIDVLGNDLNLPETGLTLSIAAGGQPSNGAVAVNLDGTVSYMPENGFLGTDSFIYEICNTAAIPDVCSRAVVRVQVYELPRVQTDTFYLVIDEDSYAQVCGDYFETADASEIFICSPGANGYCQVNSFPCTDYLPDDNFNGTDMFCVVACDEQVCDTSIFFVAIRPVNDEPHAGDDIAATYEEMPVVIDILSNDHDVDNDLLISGVTIFIPPANGVVTLGPGSGITYTPDAGFIGMDTLVYSLCDGGEPSLCDQAEVVIHINPLTDTSRIAIWEDSSAVVCAESYALLSGNSAWFILQDGRPVGIDGPCVNYEPQQDFNGADTVIIVFCAAYLCDTNVIIIDILPVNDAPVAGDDAGQTVPGQELVMDLAANDSDTRDGGEVDRASLTIITDASNGVVSTLGDGSVLYIPDPGFAGTDVFTYTICDQGVPLPALCDTAVVVITVNGGENRSCMVPSSFSPNGDGLYDRFYIECAADYPDLRLFIYDRFGNQMYQSESGYMNDWDGTSMNNGKPLREGTYFWIVRFNDGHTKDRAGYVLIWR